MLLRHKDREMNDNIKQANAMASEAVDKHIMLDNAINDIDNVINHAQELLNRIEGLGAPLKETDQECVTATLQSVLDSAPSGIRGKCEAVHNLLNEINQRLF